MSKHIIYDWETCGNAPDSAVASIAVIVFDPAELKPFNELVDSALRVKFNLKEQFAKFGRTFDKETIDWWKGADNKEAYDLVIKPDTSIDISLSEFGPILEEYLKKMGYVANDGEKVWTRGNEFDPPMLKHIYKYFGWEVPYPWWNIRDVRTEIDAITQYWDPNHEGYGYIKSFPYPEGFIKHTETHDCARDILMMQHAHINMITYMENLSGEPGTN